MGKKADAATALAELLEGNRRFSDYLPHHPHQDETSRYACRAGQQPRAVIVGCSDSRVPPELVFDCGIGDLFVIRSIGTVLDPAGIAGIEYAVSVLMVPLVMVLGHSSCGAVAAALSESTPNGSLGGVLAGIRNTLRECTISDPTDVDGCTRAYTTHVARSITEQSPSVQSAANTRNCRVVPAFYSFEDGLVSLL